MFLSTVYNCSSLFPVGSSSKSSAYDSAKSDSNFTFLLFSSVLLCWFFLMNFFLWTSNFKWLFCAFALSLSLYLNISSFWLHAIQGSSWLPESFSQMPLVTVLAACLYVTGLAMSRFVFLTIYVASALAQHDFLIVSFLVIESGLMFWVSKTVINTRIQ